MSFFTQSTESFSKSSTPAPATTAIAPVQLEDSPIFMGYLSDLPSDNTSSSSSEDEADDEGDKPPPKKRVRRKLDIPAHIEKLIASKRTAFDAGQNSLQAYRARAIQSHLQMVVRNKRKAIEVSEIAAESQGFAPKWGGRMVRTWVGYWLKNRELPASVRGKHGKVFSLLDDPNICEELRSYVRSNKWAMDPAKLAELSKDNLVSAAADKYLRHIVDTEMPAGLKKYMDVELFPRLHLKAGWGISLTTAKRWLHREGFRYTEHKNWVPEDEHALKKKGQGRGMHQSDVIMSTIGWLIEASQSLKYGKSYDGYWTGEMFVKQIIEKIIPAFEGAHGPGFQLLLVVDNSQRHAAYAIDALLVQRMNMNPGGKQALMRPGWFMKNGVKVVQPMVFPANHPKYPGQAKGMKQLNFIEFFWGAVKKYLRDNCDYTFVTLKKNLPNALASVQLSTIHKWEHRMVRWMDAYRLGLGAKDAQLQVRARSSRKTYTSHRRVNLTVARTFDQKYRKLMGFRECGQFGLTKNIELLQIFS
ncbi:hypothetical protein DFH08DRAFT_912378 [Mycena albidolilacea]|uniref:Uncharacterized protein n=1 Tax=Mycena albidolilacea TaxID=1033008 RepID=A0AAD7ACN7_9AGAR|nr:hypothetical protein DFH08DRAFT_912378 [Mycena albidolilacea]